MIPMGQQNAASRRAIVLAAAATVAMPRIARAQALRMRFNIGWRVDAASAGYILAAERGYYRDEGLDVTIVPGNGSAGAVTQVAAGADDGAAADLGVMIQHNIANPGRRLIAVAIVADRNPNGIVVRVDGPIQGPRDVVGKRIAAQPTNAARVLFPVFARAQGIAVDSVQWQSVDPGLATQLFLRRDLDGIATFVFNGLFNLVGAGLPLSQLRGILYADHGLLGYGNGLVIDPRFVQANPAAVAGFVRATTRGWLDCVADPTAGARAVKARVPLADEAVEAGRLRMMTETTMITDAVRADGWGVARADRVRATIEETILAHRLAGTIGVEEVFTDRFLAAPAIRTLRVPGG
jgi:NitT/TauT family transport system substrate-binding protein